MNINKLPPKIKEQLEKKGYFNLTTEQRVAANKRCFDAILRSSKGDPLGEKEALKGLRGS